MFDQSKELIIRTRLVEELSEIAELENIFGEVLKFSGREHFSNYIGHTSQDTDNITQKEEKLELFLVFYAMIDWVDFKDALLYGTDKNTAVTLVYNIEIFQQIDIVRDDYSSSRVWATAMAKLRNKFLIDLNIPGLPLAKRSTLKSLGPWSSTSSSSRVPGITGYSWKAQVTVDVR